jgi:hypothetical protein
MVTLMRPTAITSAVLSGGIIGTAGSTLKIKVKSARLRYRIPNADTTGDGDTHPQWTPSLFMHADWILRGWAVAASAIGMANLYATATNPSDATKTRLYFDASRYHEAYFVIAGVDIEWDRTAPYVGISISLRMTIQAAGGGTGFTEV